PRLLFRQASRVRRAGKWQETSSAFGDDGRRGDHGRRSLAFADSTTGTTGTTRNAQHNRQCDGCKCKFFHEQYSYSGESNSWRFVVTRLFMLEHDPEKWAPVF